jgi:hypothetical protein
VETEGGAPEVRRTCQNQMIQENNKSRKINALDHSCFKKPAFGDISPPLVLNLAPLFVPEPCNLIISVRPSQLTFSNYSSDVRKEIG